jgi:integrase
MITFQSVYADRMADYVHLRQSLGYRFRDGALLLRLFDRFLVENGQQGPLTGELALAFATRNPANTPQHQAALFHTVKLFSEYLATFDPTVRPLDPVPLRPMGRPHPPHIYTDGELQRLLEETHRYVPQQPFRGLALRTMIGLAASTGLRIGEVIRLNDTDLDLRKGTLTIHHTKFNKHRLVPPHPTALDALRHYLRMRNLVFPDPHCEALFVNHHGERFRPLSLQGAFRKLVRRANIQKLGGGYPTFHHLRHTFAVKRLVAWYRGGLDVQALLPVLATYLGHVGYSETAYYLSANPELLELARTRAQGPPVPWRGQL